jgi:outer membrane receptor protein involved in Fe transport
LFLLFVATCNQSPAQCAISSKVTDSLAAPVPFIAVALLKTDSSVYKGEFTSEKGEFCFSKINKGSYRIKISAIGYADYYSELISYDSVSHLAIPSISLRKNSVALTEVSTVAMRDPIEFKGGNITVNVEDSPLAVGNSVYDLISRLPGVMVEGDNISIQGKSGVRIYINDRIQQVSGAQLTNFLRSMSASTVEKIEVINNPPAKYDAAGGAGVINIKTKRIKITGPSGGFNYTYSQGFYSTSNGSFAFNYKARKVSFFSNTSVYEGSLHNVTNMLNHVTYDNVVTTMDQKAYENDVARHMTVDLGMDWYMDRSNTIGVKAQLVPGHAARTYDGNTYMSDNSMGFERLVYNRPIINNWFYCNFNVNAEHLFDTLGTKLKFSLDYYGPYSDINKATYQNKFLDRNDAEIFFEKSFKTSNYLGVNIWVPRLDFEKTFKHDLSLESGIKYSGQGAWSNYTMEDQMPSGVYVINKQFTNNFRYNEQISSGYVSMDKKYKKFNFRAGLRGEYTDIHTASLTNGIAYTRQYFNMFPVLSADYNPSMGHALSLSYNRRINRPDYNSFNPFRSFNNILSSSEGNPFLMPVYDNNFNFSYIYKRSVFNYFSYANEQNPIFSYTSQNDTTKEMVTHYANLKELNVIRYNFFARYDVRKWWNVSFLLGAYYVDYSGLINGLNYTTKAVPWYTRLNSNFIVRENTKIEISGFYWSPWLGSATKYLERGGFSIAVKQSFLNKNLNLSIAMNDIFFTEQFRQKADFQNQKWTLYEAHDSRRLNISISYNFGRIKAEQRDTKENDEERRLKH